MSDLNIASLAFIYLIIPLIGLLLFLRLAFRWHSQGAEQFTLIELFVLFASYGVLLLIVLITLFLNWSGMTTLGMAYLILIAPFLMWQIARRNKAQINASGRDRILYRSAKLYFFITPAIIALLFLIVTLLENAREANADDQR